MLHLKAGHITVILLYVCEAHINKVKYKCFSKIVCNIANIIISTNMNWKYKYNIEFNIQCASFCLFECKNLRYTYKV